MVETVEAFCAEHTLPFETVLYEWPSSKFQALYGAYVKRKVADELANRKNLELAALWGNSNYDSEKEPNPRMDLMRNIEESYDKSIASLYGYSQEEEEIDEDDPFFQAMNRGLAKRKLPEVESPNA